MYYMCWCNIFQNFQLLNITFIFLCFLLLPFLRYISLIIGNGTIPYSHVLRNIEQWKPNSSSVQCTLVYLFLCCCFKSVFVPIRVSIKTFPICYNLEISETFSTAFALGEKEKEQGRERETEYENTTYKNNFCNIIFNFSHYYYIYFLSEHNNYKSFSHKINKYNFSNSARKNFKHYINLEQFQCFFCWVSRHRLW